MYIYLIQPAEEVRTQGSFAASAAAAVVVAAAFPPPHPRRKKVPLLYAIARGK